MLYIKNKKTPILILLTYILVAFVAMMPTTLNFSTYKYGSYKGSDSLGIINSMWWYSKVNTKNKEGVAWNYSLGAPTGRKFSLSIVTPIPFLSHTISKLFNPIVGYNFIIFISFVLAGICFHFVSYSFTRCHLSSFFGGIAYAISPFHLVQAADHMSLAQTWVFPIWFYFFVNMYNQRSYRASTYLILMTIGALIVHGYYGLFLLITQSILFAYLLLKKKIKFKPANIKLLAYHYFSLLLLVLLWQHLSNIVKIGKNGDITLFTRPISHLYIYGIRLYEFFLPPHYSLLFKNFSLEVIKANPHSNYAEFTIFLGYTLLILSIWFCYKLLVQDKLKKETSKLKKKLKKHQSLYTFDLDREIIIFLFIILIIPFIFGFPPDISILGIKIPTMSKLMYNFLPMLRTLSRFAILTIFAVCCLASFGLHVLIVNFSKRKKIIISFVMLFLVFVEFTNIHAHFYLDSTQIPGVYDEVKKIEGDSLILDLPFNWGFFPAFWQTYHGKPLYNIFSPSHPNYKRIIKIQQLKRLELIMQKCKELKITHIVVHTPMPLGIGKVFHNKVNKNTILPNFAKYSNLITIDNNEN
ncbi:hypothetical protein ISS03_03445 [Patescibacteria group bacterium]|nr:hypothetical protein [Patescibacteria group bacterium]